MRNQQQTKQSVPKVARLSVSTMTEVPQKDGTTKTFWTSIGTAFEGEKGITVILNALPVNGKMFISEVRSEQ